jgi:hypothetical protein
MAAFGARFRKASIFGTLVVGSLCFLAEPGRSETDLLSGLWTGGGTVTYASGDRERARCRVHYAPRGGKRVAATATCATASGSVNQTAILAKTGEGRYSGRFFNEQYSVTGSIQVIVKGGSQLVRLFSSGGSALLNLSR